VIRAVDAALAAPAAAPPKPAARSAVASLVLWMVALAAAIAGLIILWPKPESTQEALEAFERSLATELVGAEAWGGWEQEGAVSYDREKNAVVLSGQARVLRRHPEAGRGFRVRWSLAAGAPDSAAFTVALSSARWFEIGPHALTLFPGEGNARRIEFADRVSGGVFSVFPHAGQVLVYLDRRLLFRVTEREVALGDGLRFGMSGGVVRLESVRVR
jgi:hypothetical protein